LPDRWLTTAFLLFLFCLCAAGIIILFHDGNEIVLPIALASGAFLLALEHLEIRYIAGSTPGWNPLPGYLAPVVAISLAIFAVSLPMRNIYFVGEDFAYIRLFHTLSLNQFLRMFHTDMSEVLSGLPQQELRPLFSFYYMVGYRLWGIHPLGYHLAGVLLHLLNSVMVFLIAKSFSPNESWRAAFAGLLFAVQPSHSETISWISGAFTEGPATIFYLVAVLCFVFYRSSGLARYLVIATVAFAAGLLNKEITVTLPVMLVSYDLFRKVVGEAEVSTIDDRPQPQPWRRLVLAYIPFVVVALAYLGWRRLVFASYLRDEQIGSHVREALSGSAGFLHQFAFLAWKIGRIQVFNLRHLLLPFPTAVLGFVLGLYFLWAFSLIQHRSECRRSLGVVVYFGLVWYLINNAPLLRTGPLTRHLYLPAVGPCIATAFIAAPACEELRKRAGIFRLLGAVFLLCASAYQLRKENAQWVSIGELTARRRGQLEAALADIPKAALVVITLPPGSISGDAGWDGMSLPDAMQPPFTSTDFYSRARIVQTFEMDCCSLSQWWNRTKLALTSELAGPSEENFEIHILAWDVPSDSFRVRRRVLSKGLLRASLTQSLGGSVEAVNDIQKDSADQLVRDLARLVSDGG